MTSSRSAWAATSSSRPTASPTWSPSTSTSSSSRNGEAPAFAGASPSLGSILTRVAERIHDELTKAPTVTTAPPVDVLKSPGTSAASLSDCPLPGGYRFITRAGQFTAAGAEVSRVRDEKRLRRPRERDEELAQARLAALLDDPRRFDDDDMVELEPFRLARGQDRDTPVRRRPNAAVSLPRSDGGAMIATRASSPASRAASARRARVGASVATMRGGSAPVRYARGGRTSGAMPAAAVARSP